TTDFPARLGETDSPIPVIQLRYRGNAWDGVGGGYQCRYPTGGRSSHPPEPVSVDIGSIVSGEPIVLDVPSHAQFIIDGVDLVDPNDQTKTEKTYLLHQPAPTALVLDATIGEQRLFVSAGWKDQSSECQIDSWFKLNIA